MELKEILSNLSSDGSKPRILFHVDDHRKMCEIKDGKYHGSEFNKWVMIHLFKCGTVVPTDTDIPCMYDISHTSSEYYRNSISIPSIDIASVMKKVKLKDENGNDYYPFHFPFDKESLDREGKRLIESVKFKLGFKLATLGMTSIHFPCEEFTKFCKQFKNTIDDSKNPNEILKLCNEKCSVH